GWARLATKPNAMGSLTSDITMGIVEVAFLAALIAPAQRRRWRPLSAEPAQPRVRVAVEPYSLSFEIQKLRSSLQRNQAGAMLSQTLQKKTYRSLSDNLPEGLSSAAAPRRDGRKRKLK